MLTLVKSDSAAFARRNLQVEEYAHLVRPLARALARSVPSSIDVEDLEQAGMLGLMAACDHPERARGEFATYARLQIRGAMLDSIKGKQYRQQQRGPYLVTEELPAELPSAAPSIETTLIEREEAEARAAIVRRGIHLLPARQAKVITLRAAGAKPREIRKQLHIGERTFRSDQAAAMKQLKAGT